jgi:hypothetical protein
MKTLHILSFVALALLRAAVPLSAHHSWPVSRDKLVTVRGTVTEIMWGNPHPMFTLDVKGDDGRIEKWRVGGSAISRMEGRGWTKATVKPGDVITGIGYQFADGQKIVRLEKVVLPNGQEISVYGR